MDLTVVLISGLQGCGKSTLARRTAERLNIPLFAKDRFQSLLRQRGLAERNTADGYHLMFDMADEQLSLGVSIILDAVFPLSGFRQEVAQIAQRHQARFRPVYCYCSDEAEWRKRISERQHNYVPHWSPMGWEEVERFREMFTPWPPETTLFIDAMTNLETNVEAVCTWLKQVNNPK